MKELAKGESIRTVGPRAAAMVAASALLVMAVIAASANFGVIETLTVPGDPAATATNIAAKAGLFRLAAVGLVMVAVLDVVVAWGLYLVLRRANSGLALLASGMRVLYAAVFATAIGGLFAALRVASAGPGAANPGEALFLLEGFQEVWAVAMIFFGIHLCLISVLVWRPGVFSRIIAVLLGIAGVGYLVDNLGSLLSPAYTLEIGMFTFIGEVIFIVWLFILGGKDRAVRAVGESNRNI